MNCMHDPKSRPFPANPSMMVLGGGVMGALFAESALAHELVSDRDLTIIERNPERCVLLVERFGRRVYSAALGDARDVLLLSIKPQDAAAGALEGLSQYIHPETLVISVMAGVETSFVSRKLNGHRNIVRAMPNTPAQIGLGMHVWHALPEVSSAAKDFFVALFSASGKTLEVADESLMHSATAVSGSGPAYVFFLIEALEAAAADLGMSPQLARESILQTVLGAASLWGSSDKCAAELRQKVTSKGGTTEAAMRVLQAGDVASKLREAVGAAAARAKELALAE